MWALSGLAIQDQFNLQFSQLEEDDPDLHTFLEKLPKESWARSFFVGRDFAIRTSNHAESFNNWIREERCRQSPLLVFDGMREHFMSVFLERRNSLLDEDSSAVSPDTNVKVQKAHTDGAKWRVRSAGEVDGSSEFEVKLGTERFVVCPSSLYKNLATISFHSQVHNRGCSCRIPALMGYPCVHLCAVLRKQGGNLLDHVDACWKIGEYRLSYFQVIHAQATEVYAEDSLRPPNPVSGIGRKRLQSAGEGVLQCGLCRRYGHNRAGCC
eukprot:TRINITY_DN14998_c0_g1_i1.p3 TRINITY_DN14998_c0_g1~~TRINITY_DN14998_c0_g1_i1.p3  ORF type:complete len:268 (-),score=70.22 TRINITY_DN14998_c0_g1_i1:118-921(-)